MSTDRELLELAAKAASYEINFDEPVGYPVDYYPHGYDEDGDVKEWWNPLHDDGDALRLAVKLDMLHESPAFLWHLASAITPGADPFDATRRAIVRAAAEIARGK